MQGEAGGQGHAMVRLFLAVWTYLIPPDHVSGSAGVFLWRAEEGRMAQNHLLDTP